MNRIPSRHRIRALSAAAGLLALAGCAAGAGTPVTDAAATLSPAYDPASVGRAARDGLPTVVHGNPFAMPRERTERLVLASLRMPGWHRPAGFVAHPDPGERRGYRLVVVFNPARPVGHGAACRDLGDIALGPGAATTRLHAAFCASERPLSHIGGRADLAGPDDPAFRRLLAQALDQLLPPRNHLTEDDDHPRRRWIGAYRLAPS